MNESRSVLWTDDQKITEYEKKNQLLDALFFEVTPQDFYYELYFDSEVEVPYRTTGSEDAPAKIKKMELDAALELAGNATDAVLHVCSFRNNYPKKNLVTEIYALVVDIDYCSAALLQEVIASSFKNKDGVKFPEPSIIVNSGAGVHFYYFLDEVLFYKRDRDFRDYIDHCNKQLTLLVSNLEGITPDTHAISQGYRIVGSKTKFGKVTRAFSVEPSEIKRWKFEDLVSFLPQVEKKKIQNDSQAIIYYEVMKAAGEKKSTFGLDVKKWNLNRGFYDAMLKKCAREIDEGHRYYSLMALSVIAYKCSVPLQELITDLRNIVDIYNKKPHSSAVKYSEISNAVRVYNVRAATVTSNTLEEWLGFKFKHFNRHSSREDRFPRIKTDEMRKNGQPSNLEARAWKVRDEKYPNGSWRKNAGRKSVKDRVEKWMIENPNGSPEECQNETGLCLKTVKKWWNQITALNE